MNFNSTDALAHCLRGLQSQWLLRIVVLDNLSNRRDRQALIDLTKNDPAIVTILSDTNLGFGAGHNHIAGLTRHDGPQDELIWILNPDTVVSPGAVDALCGILVSGDVDILSPVILTGDRERPVTWFAGGVIDARRGRVTHLNAGGDPRANSRNRLFPTDFVTGAAPLMTRTTWNDLGGFRSDLFLYWEDVDLSLRAKKLGKKLAVAGDVSIWHAEGGSSKLATGLGPTTYYYSARNRILVCSEFGSPLGLTLGRGLPTLIRLAATALLKGRRSRFTKLWSVVRGTWDGVRGRTGARPRD